MTRTALHLNFLLLLLANFFLNPPLIPTVEAAESSSPGFADFYESVPNEGTDILQGVYVADVLALPVVQQPADKPYYVSNHDGEVTQFALASRYGNIGLLAHNTLAGKWFSGLAVGQEVRLIYGDGKVEYFVIAETLQFQALQPESVTSSFRNLDGEEVLSAGQLFNRAYVGERRVVFQTCIKASGSASWGRLFVIAVPKE